MDTITVFIGIPILIIALVAFFFIQRRRRGETKKPIDPVFEIDNSDQQEASSPVVSKATSEGPIISDYSRPWVRRIDSSDQQEEPPPVVSEAISEGTTSDSPTATGGITDDDLYRRMAEEKGLPPTALGANPKE
jgi:hypothetical protein